MVVMLPRNVSLGDVDRAEFDRTLAALDDYLSAKASLRQSALLRYLLKEEMEGRGDRIKAFTIAQDIFGKDENFDPTNNSLIRVEVHRLRASIQNFYQKYDGQYRYILHIPTGSYRVTVEEQSLGDGDKAAVPPATSHAPVRSSSRRYGLIIAALLALAAVIYGGLRYLAPGILGQNETVTRSCPEGLPLVAVQFVAPKEDPAKAKGTTPVPKAKLEEALEAVTKAYPLAQFYTDGSCAEEIHYDLILDVQSLNVRAGSHAGLPRYRISYQLITRKDKRTAAFGEFENDAAEPADRLPIIIAKVVNHLFDRFGAVVWDYIRDTKREGAVTGYECLAMAYRFVSVSNGEGYNELSDCMDDAVHREGLEAYLLSMDAVAMHYLIVEKIPYSPMPTMAEIEATLDKAEAIDPSCSDCLYVKTRMLRHSGNPTGTTMLYYLNQMEQNWPYDALLLEHAALIAGPYFGQWDRAEGSIARAKATIGSKDEFSFYSLSRAILVGDKERALKTAKEIVGIRAPLFAVEVVAAAQLGGDTNLVIKGKKYLSDIGINNYADAVQVLQQSGIEPRLMARIQTHLADAYNVTPPPQ